MTPFEQAQTLCYGKIYMAESPPPLFAVLREERRQFTRSHSRDSRLQCAVLYAWQSYNPAAKQPERN